MVVLFVIGLEGAERLVGVMGQHGRIPHYAGLTLPAGALRLARNAASSFRFWNQQNHPPSSQGRPRSAMSSTAILFEAKQLHNVGDRLDLLAELHPVVSEALLTISGNVRQTATLLEVLVATKMRSITGSNPEES